MMSNFDLLNSVRTNLSLPQEVTNYLFQFQVQLSFVPKVVFDIGACVLHWTDVARRVWPDAKFILFDASDFLEKLYSTTDYDFFIALLSEKSGTEVDFFQNEELFSGNSYYRENPVFNPIASVLFSDAHAVKRKTISLDDLVSQNSLPPPELIKIDVQGSELDVLKGGVETLKSVEHLFIELRKVEYNLGAPDSREVSNFLEAQSFDNLGKISETTFDADFHFKKRRT